MTNATVVETNTTKHAESIKYETDCKDEKICIKTEIPEIVSQVTNNTNNISTNSINNTDVNDTIKNKNQILSNRIPAKDTILKYVYKNGEKAEIKSKHKGSFQNQLKRRKRSIQDPLSPLPSKFQEPTLIVNYETSHGPTATAGWSPQLKSVNIKEVDRAGFEIVSRHGNTNNKDDGYTNKVFKPDSTEVRNQNEDSKENTDREKYKHHDNKEDTSNESDESGESGEQDQYRKKQDHSAYKQNSAESYEDGIKGNDQYDSNESSENYSNKKSDYNASESDESVESSDANNYGSNERPLNESQEYSKYNYARKPYSPLKKKYTGNNQDSSSEDTSESSSETYIHSIKPYEKQPPETYNTKLTETVNDSNKENKHKGYSISDRHPQKSNLEHNKPSYGGESKESSTKSSSESQDKEINLPSINALKNDVSIPVHNRSLLPIQEIDLRDFSYERINVNENGKVVAVKENSENINPDVEIISPKIISDKKSHDVLELVKNKHKPLNYSDKLTHINDGEVKPVVELNTEYDEDSSERNIDIHANIYDALETNFKDKETNERDEKLLKEHKAVENLKQEYERIPLNYNHNENIQIDTSTKDPLVEEVSKDKESSTEDDAKQDITITKSEGSIDIAPDDIKYDEHLKTKFDDIQIKLPEIKLPDDILSFTKSNSPYNYEDNDEDRNSHYTGQQNKRQNNEDSDNDDHEKAVPFYYGYYDDNTDKNQNYKKKNNDDDEDDEEDTDEDDLYEKFVRERFGKRGTFEKRSERLQKRPLNPQLTQTVQNILKKTASIDEQAKKSGDPNAGYMWTLEYGENL